MWKPPGVTRQLSFLYQPPQLLSTIFSEKNSNFTNAYIRFRFRNTLVVRNSLKVLAFSVAFCILFLVAVLGMSRFFSRTVINWNSYESYYYLCEGCISNVGFAKVVMKTFVCLLIPTIFFSELICAFGCIINKVFPFLVTVTTCIAVSFDGDWNIDFWLLIFWDNYSIRTKFIVHEKKGFFKLKVRLFFRLLSHDITEGIIHNRKFFYFCCVAVHIY